ncbi:MULTISPECIES: hypothetical protein [Haloarcula]|uniref:hypothetical protein n=1 Tax=Haloarcula TaxID=2237 RepID=UPI0023EC8B7D|nr:hypothetical protein [Halomicroarcula sp. XH51]
MSSVTPFESPAESVPNENAPVRSLVQSLALRPLRFVGFWVGVLAPLAYPLLLFGGLDAQSLFVLLGVVVLNVAGLLLGRGYGGQP